MTHSEHAALSPAQAAAIALEIGARVERARSELELADGCHCALCLLGRLSQSHSQVALPLVVLAGSLRGAHPVEVAGYVSMLAAYVVDVVALAVALAGSIEAHEAAALWRDVSERIEKRVVAPRLAPRPGTKRH